MGALSSHAVFCGSTEAYIRWYIGWYTD